MRVDEVLLNCGRDRLGGTWGMRVNKMAESWQLQQRWATHESTLAMERIAAHEPGLLSMLGQTSWLVRKTGAGENALAP